MKKQLWIGAGLALLCVGLLASWATLSRASGAKTFTALNGSESERGRKIALKSQMEEKTKIEERKRKARLEKEVEMGLVAKVPEADFELLTPDGKISPEAIAISGVSVKNVDKVQSIIDGIWDEMARSVASRAQMDEGKSDLERGVVVYNIPADRERGDLILNEMELELTNEVGAGSAKILLSGLHPRFKFGWFGKLDMNVEFKEIENPPRSGSFETMVKYSGKDPATQKEIIAGELDKQNFESQYGHSFELPDK